MQIELERKAEEQILQTGVVEFKPFEKPTKVEINPNENTNTPMVVEVNL